MASTLFKSLLKFCSADHLFTYLKRRYDTGEVKILNNLIKLKGKLRTQLASHRFLTSCLVNRVVPGYIQGRITRSKVRQSASIEQAFLQDAASRSLEKFSALRQIYRSCWRRARSFLSFFDMLRLCRYIADIDSKVLMATDRRNSENVNKLIRKRFGLTRLSPDKVITNLSDYTLSQAESFVLSHGLDFCVPNSNVSAESVFTEFESLTAQLERLKPHSEQAYNALKAKLLHLAHNIAGSSISHNDLSSFREHFRVISDLRKNGDILITKPDKGTGVVIMNKSKYIEKMSAILNDTNTFVPLGPVSTHDKTSRNEAKLQKYLLGLVKSNNLPRDIYDEVRPTGSQRPRLYGLPKIHKTGVPLRPILSMIGSAQHQLAKWLSKVLQPVLEHYSKYCVRDSFSFATHVRNLTNINHSACFLGSFDIASLFTNVPLKETIEICANYIFSREHPRPPFTKPQFIELMNLVTSSVEFSFNNVMYRQTNGVAMGSPLGPILANIFVGFHELRLFSNDSPPLTYKRYVDDTFSVFHSRSEFDHFLTKLNHLHPSLKFTSETEKDGKLAFLDVLVHKHEDHFSTSVYRKPTFTGLYMRWNSFSPSCRKTNLIKCLTHRAVNLCSPIHLAKEISNIRNIFVDNGFPEHVVNACISSKVASLTTQQKYGPRKCPIYVRLPWKGQVSIQFERQIKSAVSGCFGAADLRLIYCTKSLIPHTHKDRLPSSSLNNVIYKFTCRCEAVYVGRTSQRLEDRIKQHVPKCLLSFLESSRSGNQLSLPQNTLSRLGRSAIGQHFLDSPACAKDFSFDQFSILERARNTFQLHVLEAWHIHFSKPQLCKQKELVYKLKLLY